MSTDDVIKVVMNNLAYLRPYVSRTDEYGSVVYLKFEETRLKTVRVSDHSQTDTTYKYKWNLRKDISAGYTGYDGGVKRFYFSYGDVYKMCSAISGYYNKIVEGDKVIKAAEIAADNIYDETIYGSAYDADVAEEEADESKIKWKSTEYSIEHTDADLFNETIIWQAPVMFDQKDDDLYKILHMLNVLVANKITHSSDDIDVLTDKLFALKVYSCKKDTIRHIVQLYFPILAERGDINAAGKITFKSSGTVLKYIKFLIEYCNIMVY